MPPRPALLPKAIALVPVAALSIGWSVHAVRTPSVPTASLTEAAARAGTKAPSTSSPASTQFNDAITVSGGSRPAATVFTKQTPSTPTANAADIPATALAAYQRAATIIDTADPSCHLDWSLLAAIGRVESDHGRTGGSQLSPSGVATPPIVGPALSGTDGTTLVSDTDGGSYDGDPLLDHAVGPMQFLPATWASVGVDADGDGQRNPQDINDAALGAAVYLCSGDGDLATPQGQQAAVFRYNHATSYVESVLAIAQAYQADGVAAVDVPAIDARLIAPGAADSTAPAKRHHKHLHKTGTSTTPSTTAPTTPPAPPAPSVPPSTAPSTQPDTGALTTRCTSAISTGYPDATADALQQAVAFCVSQLGTVPKDQLDDALSTLLAALPKTVDGLGDPAPEPSGSASGTPDPTPSATPSDNASDSPSDSPSPIAPSSPEG